MILKFDLYRKARREPSAKGAIAARGFKAVCKLRYARR